jgi:outer membrane protein OmpA-like peptidoglycan-associated protein
MQVTKVATVASAEARLADSAAGLAGQARAGAAQAKNVSDALGVKVDGLEKWRAAQEADSHAPGAVLARLARETTIWFGDGVDFVDPELAKRQIGALAAQLKAGGGGLRVVGYSDSAGTVAKNLSLSQQRADAIVAVLLAEGVESSKVVAVGRADQAAIEAPGGPKQRRNRRARFEMLDQAEQGQ